MNICGEISSCGASICMRSDHNIIPIGQLSKEVRYSDAGVITIKYKQGQ